MPTGAREFTVEVHREGEGLWAEVHELPGCFASGDSFDELRDAVGEAIRLYLDDDAIELTSWSQIDEPVERHRVLIDA